MITFITFKHKKQLVLMEHSNNFKVYTLRRELNTINSNHVLGTKKTTFKDETLVFRSNTGNSSI